LQGVEKKFNPTGAGSAGGWLLVEDEWNAQLIQSSPHSLHLLIEND